MEWNKVETSGTSGFLDGLTELPADADFSNSQEAVKTNDGPSEWDDKGNPKEGNPDTSETENPDTSETENEEEMKAKDKRNSDKLEGREKEIKNDPQFKELASYLEWKQGTINEENVVKGLKKALWEGLLIPGSEEEVKLKTFVPIKELKFYTPKEDPDYRIFQIITGEVTDEKTGEVIDDENNNNVTTLRFTKNQLGSKVRVVENILLSIYQYIKPLPELE